MLPELWCDQFRREGYYLTPPVLSQTALAPLRRECEARIRSARGWAALGLARDGEAVRAFAKLGIFREICEATLGGDVDLFFDSALAKPPHRGKRLRWHQDAAYGRTDPEAYVSCWVPLDAVDERNGCLRVAPRSHLGGWSEHAAAAEDAESFAGPVAVAEPEHDVALPAAPGQIVVLDSRLLHCSGPNESGETRLAYLCGFVHSPTRFLDRGLPSDLKLPWFRRTEPEAPGVVR